MLETIDPGPVRICNADGSASFLLIGDHAGNLVPTKLDGLGISTAERERHIGLDIGVSALGKLLSRLLDAPFIEQRYSRLVVDCNRSSEAADAIPPISDGTTVPGNAGLSPADRAERYAAIFDPYHAAIAEALTERDGRGQETILVSLHSFTPVMAGVPRPWPLGVLHDRGDARFAQVLLAVLREQGTFAPLGDNAPYQMDGTDYTVPRHAYPDRPYAELEVRQDLLGDAAGIAAVANALADTLVAARDRL